MNIDDALAIRAQAMLDQARDLYFDALARAVGAVQIQQSVRNILRDEIRALEKYAAGVEEGLK